MSEVLTEFIGLIGGGITTLAKSVGSGLNTAVKEMFLAVNETGAVTGLSTFGGIIAVFAGVALAIGLTTKIFMFITSLGKN